MANSSREHVIANIPTVNDNHPPDATDITERWNNFHLSDDDDDDIIIEKDWVADAVQVAAHCLVGRLLLKKVFNIDAMKNLLSRAWKLHDDVLIKEIGDHIFLFQFASIMDKDRVLLRQPWT
ncbi:hypothetical protein DITRI_Ditri19aG0032200 [Diplodiscus trichospermus]